LALGQFAQEDGVGHRQADPQRAEQRDGDRPRGVLAPRAQQGADKGQWERADQDQQHLTLTSVQRSQDHPREGEEAHHVHGPDAAHDRVELVQGSHAQHDQPERENEPARDDDEQGEGDGRQGVEHPRGGVRGAPARLAAGGHL